MVSTVLLQESRGAFGRPVRGSLRRELCAVQPRVHLDKSSVSGLVDRAQRRGLVERVPSATDGRAVLVRLTGYGRELVSDGAARFAAEVSLLLEHLPPADRDVLSALVSRLLVAHAAGHGIDLFATTVPGTPVH